MGELIRMPATPRRREKRQHRSTDYLRGQKILADAIFHWKNEDADDARAAVRFLVHHLATAFRADDHPLQPEAIKEPH